MQKPFFPEILNAVLCTLGNTLLLSYGFFMLLLLPDIPVPLFRMPVLFTTIVSSVFATSLFRYFGILEEDAAHAHYARCTPFRFVLSAVSAFLAVMGCYALLFFGS